MTGRAVALFVRMICIIFVVELLVMALLPVIFSRPVPLVGNFADAALVVLFCAPLFWYQVVRPRILGNGEEAANEPQHLVTPMIELLVAVFIVELLTMFALPRFLTNVNGMVASVFDALALSSFSAPFAWSLSVFPLQSRRQTAGTRGFPSPLQLFFKVLIAVLCMELATMFFIEKYLQDYLPEWLQFVIDALGLIIVIAPFLWFMLVRPLRRVINAEKGLSEALHAQVVDAIIMFDADGVITSFNPAAEKIFGYEAVDVIGEKVAVLLPATTATFSNIVDAAVQGRGVSGRSMSWELVGHRRDGTDVPLEISVSRVAVGEELFITIMRDMTERKIAEKKLVESEERFRQIFEQTEDAIMLFDSGTCAIIDVNPVAERLFGFSRQELMVRGVVCLCRPDELASLKGAICSIERGEMRHLDKIVNLRKDGEEIIVSLRSKIIVLQGEEVIYCTFRDITERVRMEEAARDIQSRLIHTNKMASLGQLVSGVVHEINNPNNFIMANAQMLEKAVPDAIKILDEYHREYGDFNLAGIPYREMRESAPHLFEGIVEGARRINDIVNNLKSFARQDNAVPEGTVDINRAVTTSVAIIHHQMNKYTSNFHLDLMEHLPLIKGSPQQLEQVIINLLMNACQSLADREAGISVTTEYDESAGVVMLKVHDEGVGMPPNVMERILEPFFTTKLDSGGTGLGLSISHSIIKEHNGTLDFVSEPGKGTTFTVTFPAAPPAPEENQA